MCCVSSVALSLVTGVDAAVRVDGTPVAVVLNAVGAVGAVWLQARASLGTDTNAVTLFDMLDIRTDLDGLADDLVADDAGFGYVSVNLWLTARVWAYGMV